MMSLEEQRALFRKYRDEAYDLTMHQHETVRGTVLALSEKRSMGEEGFRVYGDATWHKPLARRTLMAMEERADEVFYLATVLAELDGAYVPREGAA